MRTLFIAFLFIMTCQYSFSQNAVLPRYGITVSSGVSAMTGLPKDIDQQSSNISAINFYYNLLLLGGKEPLYLSVGAGYSIARYTTDGLFTMSGDKYLFAPTPNDFKQHALHMQYLHIPILIKMVPFKGTTTGIGIYVDRELKAESKYKIGSAKYTVDAPTQNKHIAGVVLDEEIFMLSNKKSTCIVGFGAMYQLSNNLKESDSFKPLSGYIKIGVGWR